MVIISLPATVRVQEFTAQFLDTLLTFFIFMPLLTIFMIFPLFMILPMVNLFKVLGSALAT
ncbi:MAG: hypothetical protein QXW41_08090 [Fervidicoccaceae archaeon]